MPFYLSVFLHELYIGFDSKVKVFLRGIRVFFWGGLKTFFNGLSKISIGFFWGVSLWKSKNSIECFGLRHMGIQKFRRWEKEPINLEEYFANMLYNHEYVNHL